MRPSETWGPRPPSRRRLEKRLGVHVDALNAPPASLDPYNRLPFGPLLAAHRAWRLAGKGRIDTPHAAAHPGLLVIVVVTLLGDMSTLYVSLSVIANAPAGVTAFIAVTLGALAMFLAHQVGHALGRRSRHEPRPPTALTILCGVVWLAVGTVAALMRLAAPLNPSDGLGAAPSNSVAVSILLAGLLFVLYAGNGLAAATFGYRTAESGEPGLPAWLRANRDRRLRTAEARITAYFDALDADNALRLAAIHGNPMTTDVLTVAWPEQVTR